MFRQIDTSGDGVLTLDEATPGTRSFLNRIFKEAGKGPNDRLSRGEFRAAYERLHSKDVGSEKPATNGGKSLGPTGAPTDDAPPEGLRFIDADGDGKITKAEWSKFTQSFTRLDRDKDNAVDANELKATGGAADVLAKLGDANGDGKIIRAEWARLVQNFARYDENKDNALEEAELIKVAEANATAATGSASLAGGKSSGPVLWRGRIEGREQIELLVTGNRIEGRMIGGPNGGQSLGAGTFVMTGDGKTGNMDATYTEGPQAGETCLGVYRLEGNTLQWCVNNRNGRPSSLQPGDSRATGNWLMTLTRVDNP
jgi:uncharacterized protein (TIGR03067 family)